MENYNYTRSFSIDLERANYHKKCKRRKIRRLVLVIIIWLCIIAYFLTPISKINLSVKGNVYYTKQELMDMAYLERNDYWWLVNKDNVVKVLESYDYINEVKVKKSFFGVKMVIDEIFPVAQKDDKFVLSNNDIVNKSDYPFNSKIKSITNVTGIDQEDLDYFITKYSRVDLLVRNRISDATIVSDSNGYRYVKLNGFDERIGYFVIKLDLVYLDTKFKDNKYEKIIEETNINNVKYSESNPVLVAYHYLNEEEFHIVSSFEEE